MPNLDKIAILKQENTPYYKPISDTQIGFYNTDSNTAKLQFIVHKDGFPYQLGPVNVTGYLWLKSSNGSMSGQLDLDIIDAHGGIVGVTVPNEFLKSSTNTIVTGQILLAVNGNTDVATLGEFQFRVDDALPNQVKGKVKVKYFRMFDDLKNALEQKVSDIKKSLENLDDHVSKVEEAKTTALQQMQYIKEEAKSSIENLTSGASNQLKTLTSQYQRNVNDSKESAIVNIQSKIDEGNRYVDSKKQELEEYVDSKMSDFNRSYENNGFARPVDIDNKLQNLNWQKAKLTKDDGTVDIINYVDFNNIEQYLSNISKLGAVVVNGSNTPNGTTGYGFIKIITGGENYTEVVYTPYNKSDVFTKRKWGGAWGEWTKLTKTLNDTGWLQFNLINGAQPYDGTSIPKYKMIELGTAKILSLKGAVKNITNTPIVIANLPSNIANFITEDIVFVQNTSIKSSNAAFARWAIKPNGELTLFRTSEGNSVVNETDYFPIDITITL